MTELKMFVFSQFGENTFVLYDETKEAVVIDPGCFYQPEKQKLTDFIREHKLQLKEVLYTHCHLDHLFGARFLAQSFPGVVFAAHEAEKALLESAVAQGLMFGVAMDSPPPLTRLIAAGSTVSFGNTSLEALLVPGHSPGSLCYVHHQQRFIIAGDVLFNGSIGRGDLPGGDMEALVRNIKTSLLTLPGDYLVYPGHGESTTIGAEKANNFFLQ